MNGDENHKLWRSCNTIGNVYAGVFFRQSLAFYLGNGRGKRLREVNKGQNSSSENIVPTALSLSNLNFQVR